MIHATNSNIIRKYININKYKLLFDPITFFIENIFKKIFFPIFLPSGIIFFSSSFDIICISQLLL